jgi:hypothetical protein
MDSKVREIGLAGAFGISVSFHRVRVSYLRTGRESSIWCRSDLLLVRGDEDAEPLKQKALTGHGRLGSEAKLRVVMRLGCLIAIAWLFVDIAAAECIDYEDFLHWVGSVDTPGSAQSVAVWGTHAYVADDVSGLQVINITNPASPEIVASVDTPGVAVDVAVFGTLACVADYDSGLHVIDITEPESPQIVGSVDTGRTRSVAVSSTHAYVVSDGLLVVDITNPANPQIVGSVDTPGGGVAVSGNHAYVASSSGLHIVDITNPANPQILGSVDTPDRALNVAVAGTHAYVADFRSGLQIVDITNPANPQIVGSMNTPGYASDVAVAGTHAYVADHVSGLQERMHHPVAAVLPCAGAPAST